MCVYIYVKDDEIDINPSVLWDDKKNAEAAEVAEILSEYGIEPNEYRPVVNALRKKPQAWLDFMMK